MLNVCLVGRPNSGKSTLFNALTGGDAHVGNFPGITVEVLEGQATSPSGQRLRLVDLPGTYRLQGGEDGSDEAVTRQWLSEHASKDEAWVVAIVVNGSHLRQSLPLLNEVSSLWPKCQAVVVLTQKDILEGDGVKLDEAALSEALGVLVVSTAIDDKTSAPRCFKAFEETSKGKGPGLQPCENPRKLAQKVVSSAPKGLTASQKRTAKIDSLLLHTVLGPLAFLAIMTTLFSIVFVAADPITTVVEGATGAVLGWIKPYLGQGWFASFVEDGLFGGVGTVLIFLPQIMLLVAAMEMLESTGYLARSAYLIDRLLRAVGLGGKAFVPLLSGHACSIPAISATRVLRNPTERLTAILVIPLMSCSAALPVYGLLIKAFFPGSAIQRGAILAGLYLFSLVIGLAAARLISRRVSKGRQLPLALEMPDYRRPGFMRTLRRCGREAKIFTKQAGSIILAISVLLWALLNVHMPPKPGQTAGSVETSIAARAGQALEPITAPLGFDWRINVGLIASFGAREVMVSTMGVVYGIEGADEDDSSLAKKLQSAKTPGGKPRYPKPAGFSLLVFFAIACQCMSTLAAVYRETKKLRWPLFLTAYTYGLAYVLSLVVYQGARLVWP